MPPLRKKLCGRNFIIGHYINLIAKTFNIMYLRIQNLLQPYFPIILQSKCILDSVPLFSIMTPFRTLISKCAHSIAPSMHWYGELSDDLQSVPGEEKLWSQFFFESQFYLSPPPNSSQSPPKYVPVIARMTRLQCAVRSVLKYLSEKSGRTESRQDNDITQRITENSRMRSKGVPLRQFINCYK